MLKQSQLDLCGRVDFTREVPLLGRDEGFSFGWAGCGHCCRGREDGRRVFVCVRGVRGLLPGAGGHRAVGV